MGVGPTGGQRHPQIVATIFFLPPSHKGWHTHQVVLNYYSLDFDQVWLVRATFQFLFRLSFRCPHYSFTISIMHIRGIFSCQIFSLRVQDPQDIPFVCFQLLSLGKTGQDIPFVCFYFIFSIFDNFICFNLSILYVFSSSLYRERVTWRRPLQFSMLQITIVVNGNILLYMFLESIFLARYISSHA